MSYHIANRNPYIDNIKGLLILLAVLGHLIEPLTGPLPYLYNFYAFIYIFHMPAFLLLSGYLSKGGESFNGSKIVNQLFIPFIAFSVLYEALYYLQNGEVSNYVLGLAPNWILWFLASLIFMRMISPLIMRFRYPIVITVIIAVIASIISYNGFTFNASRTLVFMPYYIAGCVLYKRTQGKLTFTVRPYAYALPVFFLIGCYLIANRLNLVALYGSMPLVASGMPIPDVIRTRLIYFVMTFLAIASVCLIAARFSWLNRFGSSSLYIYLWHGLIVKYLIWDHLNLLGDNKFVQIGAFLATGLLLVFLLSRRIVETGTQYALNGVRRMLLKKEAQVS